jgi:ribosomal protein L37E
LDTKKKEVNIDPDKRWIRTWNDYLQRIKYFMRWLHNGAPTSIFTSPTSLSDWQTPDFVRIKSKKTNRISPYSESEIWERDDLLTIIKYEPLKRNKAALALCWDLDARPHEVALLRIKNLRLGSKYGEGEIPHESKTGTGPLLLTCSFPYVRDWLNEHPFRNEPNARVLCNLNTGKPVKADTLSSIMKQLQKRIIRLIESGQITDEIERKRLESLLTSRKWTPYCIRHSAITSDSDYLPEFALKKKVRWCMNSKQPSRYIKTRMGNDLKQKILVQNGIISENNVKSSPTIAECARCQLTNPLENKYCSSCGYPLSVTAYEELKEQENSKYKSVEERLNGMQSILENLVAGLSRTTDQQQLNSVAQSLFSSGALKTTAIDSNNRALQFQQRRRP